MLWVGGNYKTTIKCRKKILKRLVGLQAFITIKVTTHNEDITVMNLYEQKKKKTHNYSA